MPWLRRQRGKRQAATRHEPRPGYVRSPGLIVLAVEKMAGWAVKPRHLVADGVTDLLRDVFGEDAGIGGRATVVVTSLARNHCFETWLTLEVRA